MSMDKSLKGKGALARHRNVLTRAERIEALKEQDRWTDASTPFGLPKVAHRKSVAGAKKKEAATVAEGEEPEAGTEGETKPKTD